MEKSTKSIYVQDGIRPCRLEFSKNYNYEKHFCLELINVQDGIRVWRLDLKKKPINIAVRLLVRPEYDYTYNFSRKSVAFFDAEPSLILIPGIVGT